MQKINTKSQVAVYISRAVISLPVIRLVVREIVLQIGALQNLSVCVVKCKCQNRKRDILRHVVIQNQESYVVHWLPVHYGDLSTWWHSVKYDYKLRNHRKQSSGGTPRYRGQPRKAKVKDCGGGGGVKGSSCQSQERHLNVNFYLNSCQLQLQCLDLNLIDYYSAWL